MSLKDKLRATSTRTPAEARPLWRGPEVDGITQSLLGRFLVDRERFRIYVVEGLRPADRWNHRTGYGDMWHVCEESFATNRSEPTALKELMYHTQELFKQYPFQRTEIEKWYHVCRVQFPIYVQYWDKHPDVQARIPLLSEQVFDVPYTLPSGRTVRLRGKWDSVDLVGGGIWLQENKTKGEVDAEQLQRQLLFDLQTMFYLVALELYWTEEKRRTAQRVPDSWIRKEPIKGVRYNVVRRPLSGGKGTIVQKKGSKNVPAETTEAYYTRLAQYIKDEPHTYFYRWNVTVTPGDVQRFRRECLDPILEQLCDWWDYVTNAADYLWNPTENRIHYRMPYGTFSSIIEGSVGELDEYLDTGNARGLSRVSSLFGELE